MYRVVHRGVSILGLVSLSPSGFCYVQGGYYFCHGLPCGGAGGYSGLHGSQASLEVT